MASNLIVAVSGSIRTESGVKRTGVNLAYVAALENARLVPLVIPPYATEPNYTALLSRVDGLVLTGGEDVDPAFYGATPHPKLGEFCRQRDATEIALCRAARASRLPTLAICRGIQVMNVAMGGTLIQDIPSERPSEILHATVAEREVRTHPVDITPGSRLAKAVGATHITVNSFHHQAVDRPADSLRVTAVAPDGIVEGMESPDDWWMLAAQWHPEEMNDSAESWDRGLFQAFAHEVERARASHP